MKIPRRLGFVVTSLIVACAHTASDHERASGAPGAQSAELRAVAAVHGAAGPWAVAGYRMGRYALTRLGLPQGSFDLEVMHYTPREVQYSCIADGAGAATGASLGKLNLALTEAPSSEVRTIYRRRSTGAQVTLRVTQAFAERFAGVPRERLADAGSQVLQLQDAEIFEEVPAPEARAD